jgi:hypothetical protein
LDTEGFDDPEKGDQSNDLDLFALSVLLSNVLVTNDALHFLNEMKILKYAYIKSKNHRCTQGGEGGG